MDMLDELPLGPLKIVGVVFIPVLIFLFINYFYLAFLAIILVIVGILVYRNMKV